MLRLLVLLPLCLAKGPRRPRQQDDAPPWLTDAYLPDASKFPPAHQPNNNQRGRREATRLARADAIVHRALCKLPTSHKKEVTALTPAKFVLEAAAARGGPVLERAVHDAAALSKWKFAPSGTCWFLRDACDEKAPILRSGPAADDFFRRLPLPLFWLSAKVRFGLQKVGPCLRSKRDALLATRVKQGAGRCVAVHVRRGDKCQTYDQGQCYATHKYAAAIQKLQSMYNYARVVVASDSPSAVTELSRLLGERARFRHGPLRRRPGLSDGAAARREVRDASWGVGAACRCGDAGAGGLLTLCFFRRPFCLTTLSLLDGVEGDAYRSRSTPPTRLTLRHTHSLTPTTWATTPRAAAPRSRRAASAIHQCPRRSTARNIPKA